MGSLVVVRHATTDASASGRNLGGRSDPPLSAEGAALAASLGRALEAELAALAIEEVQLVTSSALRCRQTLADATAGLDLPMGEVRVEPGLLEIDYGAWDGLTHAECEARDPDLRAAWDRDPFATRCPGGESGADVAARAFPVLEEVVAGLREQRARATVVVSHHHVIRLWLADVLGIAMAGYRRALRADPAGYSIITYGADRLAIRRVNAAPPAP